MLKRWQRVISDRSGVVEDVSLLAQNGVGFNADLISASGDAIYIGQSYPFNNLFLDCSGGVSGAGFEMAYWSGGAASGGWSDALDVIDGTDGFQESGVVQFTPGRDNSWSMMSDTSKQIPSGLGDFNIYDLYWLRITPSGVLNSALQIKKIAYKFCMNADLVEKDPEVNQYLVPWGGASKTNWDQQIFSASESILAELQARNLVVHQGQILRFDDVYEACIYRTLMTIYAKLGKSFADTLENWRTEYESRMSKSKWTFDKNRDAKVDVSELDSEIVSVDR